MYYRYMKGDGCYMPMIPINIKHKKSSRHFNKREFVKLETATKNIKCVFK